MEKSQRVRIKILWGGLTSYVDPKGMFEYCWDGGAEIIDGTFLAAYRIESRGYGHYFHSERWLPLKEAAWKSRTDQGMGGISLEVAGNKKTVIEINTVQKSVRFSLDCLLEKRYLRWPVGAKYSGITLTATVDDDGPFAADAFVEPDCLDVRVPFNAFKGAAHYGLFNTMQAAWVLPNHRVETQLNLRRAPFSGQKRRSDFVLELRLSLAESLEKWYVENSRYSSFRVEINDKPLKFAPVYFRTESTVWPGSQWIEFVPLPVPAAYLQKGNNRLLVRNDSKTDILTIVSAQLRERIEEDLQIVHAPAWILKNQRFDLVVQCLKAHAGVKIECQGASFEGNAQRGLPEGLCRLAFVAGDDAGVASIRVSDGNASSKVKVPVFAVPLEEYPWKVGGCTMNVKMDASGEVDFIINYCRDTQMGNYLPFRLEPGAPFRNIEEASSPKDWIRWARLCRDRDIYFSMIGSQTWKNYKAEPIGPDPKVYEVCRILKEHGGEHFFSTHFHEYSRWIYGMGAGWYEPEHGPGRTMRDAKNLYVKDVAAIEGLEGIPRQAGQSTPLMSYDYESGIDYIAVETMAFNTMHLFAAMRGSAKAYGKKVWGIHNATYWVKAPEDFTKLSLNYLNHYLTYLTGGNFTSSEDGHFNIAHADTPYGFFSEEPSRLRELIRRFYRFVNTHPRKGEQQVNIAVAQGNLSCEIISFPLHLTWLKAYIERVWGTKSGNEPKWQYGDPERGMILLDELMPYWQDGYHVRHWFTGTPYGQFDITPIWKADDELLATYKVLIFLGWNTMTPEIYEKLKRYVTRGGILFMAVPQLSTHEDRAFLEKMEDLALVNNGDFGDLFGVKIKQRGEERQGFKARWVNDFSDSVYDFPFGQEYQIEGNMRLSETEIVSARALVKDDKGNSLLTTKSFGKGRAYLLTAWDYPGRPALHKLVRDVMAALAKGSRGEVWVEDHSSEVASGVWKDKNGLANINLLNTDWTQAENVKRCRVHLGNKDFPVEVREGNFTTVTWSKDIAVYPEQQDFYVEDIVKKDARKYVATIHGTGKGNFRVFFLKGTPLKMTSGKKEISFRKDSGSDTAEFSLNFRESTRLEVEIKMGE